MTESLSYPTLFIVFEDPGAIVADIEIAALGEAVAAVPGVRDALAFTPSPPGDQPFARDGRGPTLVLQLNFADAFAADAALSATGALARIVGLQFTPSLAHARVSHQRFDGRNFPVPDPEFRLSKNNVPCTFLVEYPGTTEDRGQWLDHYDACHPPIMARFPGIREVATYRPAHGNGLPGTCTFAMQRNKVVFDSPAALEAALASPVMEEMRADAATFAPISQRATHFVMATRRLLSVPGRR